MSSISFNDIKPTTIANHIVKNLTIIAIARVVCKSNPCKVKSPAKLPSVTPKPPGDIEMEPKITDAEYILIKLKNSIKFIPKARKTNKIPIASIKRKIIVKIEQEHTVFGSEERLIIS